MPDLTEAMRGAKILVFVIPHQFISNICDQMKPHITGGTIGISLIKVQSCPLSAKHFFSTRVSVIRSVEMF